MVPQARTLAVQRREEALAARALLEGRRLAQQTTEAERAAAEEARVAVMRVAEEARPPSQRCPDACSCSW